jgi:hypothetical protein
LSGLSFPTPDKENHVNHHLKTLLSVAICMAIINRISFAKALTSESNAVII